MDFADFEISIQQHRNEYFEVYRFVRSETEVNAPIIIGQPVEVIFDFNLLTRSRNNPVAYSQHLTDMLFSSPSF